jgi:hypothetical protein
MLLCLMASQYAVFTIFVLYMISSLLSGEGAAEE